jgi:hypothetical protein
MKEPIRFARVHYTIETDNVITHEFILNLIKTNSVEKSESEKYAKIVNTVNGKDQQSIEVFSTEKVYLTVHNKKLKANIIVHEES